jgi:CDP-4-dehydro-6-deoxyglucose reductase
MAYRITIASSGVSFAANHGETILEAAENAGLDFPYGCRRGMCGTCVARVARGEVRMPGDDLFGLMDDERDRGYILMCSTYAASDLELADIGEAP